MSRQEVLVPRPATTQGVEAIVEAFIALQGDQPRHRAGAGADRRRRDLNVPQWRFQAIAAAFAESYPAGFRTSHYSWEPTPTGAIVEYDGWALGRNTYYRHLAQLQLRDGRIARLIIYCTGEWDTDTIERQRREAPMLGRDEEQTGGAR